MQVFKQKRENMMNEKEKNMNMTLLNVFGRIYFFQGLDIFIYKVVIIYQFKILL